MSFDFDAPEELGGDGGKWCKLPGSYHFTVANVLEGQTEKGTPIDGFTVQLEALDGTVKDCQGQQHTETIFSPNLNHSEESQDMARRKMASFFIACDLMTPAQLGKRGMQIDLEQSIGRQLVAELARRYDKNPDTGKYDVETKFLQFHYANLHHVDDPAVKDIPKNADAISLIDKEQRHDAAWFEPLKKKNGKKSVAQPVPAAAAATSFDDLFE